MAHTICEVYRLLAERGMRASNRRIKELARDGMMAFEIVMQLQQEEELRNA